MPERLLKIHPTGLTLCGIHLSQTWADLYIWEKVLNDAEPSRVIELGTYDGGFSVFLEAQARVRGFQFVTIDIVRQLKTSFVSDFRHLDIFENVSTIVDLIKQPGKTLLFCDNGHKEREAETFSQHLKDGDIVAVHDWGTECNIVPDYLKLHTPDGVDYEALKSMTRFFTK